jgi:hypothetical protein
LTLLEQGETALGHKWREVGRRQATYPFYGGQTRLDHAVGNDFLPERQIKE